MSFEINQREAYRTVVTRFRDLKLNTQSIRCRVKVTSKPQKSRFDERYFTLKIEDEEGRTIRGIAYGSDYERLYHTVKKDELYVFRNIEVFTADRRYPSDKFRFVFCGNSKLEEQPYKGDQIFTQLDKVSPGCKVNLIGVVHEVSSVEMIGTIYGVRSRRRVTIVDRSGYSIWLTMWGHQAEIFDGAPGDVVEAKNARIVEFGGKSATAREKVIIGSKISEAKSLRSWYMLFGRDANFIPLSSERQRREP